MAKSFEYLKKLGRAKESLMSDIGITPVGKVASSFMINSIQSMKDILANDGRNANGTLSQSLAFKIASKDGIINIDLLAEDYWDFINQGVNGIERQFGSTYSFRSLNPSPPMIDALTGTSSLRGWMAARGITSLSYTDKNGKLINKQLTSDKDFQSAAWVFAKAIKRNGIRPSFFVDKTLNEDAILKFEDEIFNAFNSML